MAKKIKDVEEKPKILAVMDEIALVGKEIHLRYAGDDDDDDDDDSEVYYVDPDPNVTETITCTSMVCSSQSFNRGDEVVNPNPLRVQFVLAPNVRLAKEVSIKFRKSMKRG